MWGYYGIAVGLGLSLISAPAEAQRTYPNPIEKCLREVWLDKKVVSDCYMLVSNICQARIVKAGVNYGSSIIYGCATQELDAWFQAWVTRLHLSQSSEHGRAATLARFADIQARAAQKCLEPPGDPLMVEIAKCIGKMYGPFLVEEMSLSSPIPEHLRTPAVRDLERLGKEVEAGRMTHDEARRRHQERFPSRANPPAR